jgi:MoxR-like ATPase
MANLPPLNYSGTVQPTSEQPNDLVRTVLYPYLPEDDLRDAVNLALALRKPLLLEGEPGCGKSRLAYALFYELSQLYKQINWKFQLWNVQSTSKAQEGFYIYDYIGRLQSAQLRKEGVVVEFDPSEAENFVEYGPMGQAFKDHQSCTVVLIDEIDKADTDFANDLLLVLEERQFEIKELRKQSPENAWVLANKEKPPIVVITSNQEKKLPPAFLRRCLYHYIEFPQKEKLVEILNQRYGRPDQALVGASVDKFQKLRTLMEDDKGENGKKVSVSEFIDWFQMLNKIPLLEAMEALNKDILVNRSTLLKNRDDYADYREF